MRYLDKVSRYDGISTQIQTNVLRMKSWVAVWSGARTVEHKKGRLGELRSVRLAAARELSLKKVLSGSRKPVMADHCWAPLKKIALVFFFALRASQFSLDIMQI